MKKEYTAPEMDFCILYLQSLLAESDNVDPVTDDPWGDF